jgi:hypothetical protein
MMKRAEGGNLSSRSHMSGKRGAFDRSLQHHLVNLLFRDGVYEQREASETFCDAEDRDLAPLEGWAIVA